MSRVVHFEIPANDTGVITKFFGDVFGWEFQKWGEQDYHLTSAGNPESPGIGGAILKRDQPGQTVANTIGVDSIDDMVPVIESNGGKIVVPKMEVEGMGFLAYFTDPEGTMHGLWESIPQSE